MDVNRLAQMMGDACYVFLAMNLLWGLFCAILVWRRLAQLRFRSERMQSQFIDEISSYVSAGDYDTAIERCELDDRALPQLTLLALVNRDLEPNQLRQLVAEHLQRDVLTALENR